MDHPRIEDAKQFLDIWFGEGIGEAPKGYILIWTNPGKRSEWFIDINKAADYAVRETTKDVYFGTCLAEQDYGARYRLHSKKRPAKGLSGLWLDLDVAGGGHKKKNYPPNLESARKIIADVPILPSVIIETGGGIHCYWAFHETWIFADDKQRQAAQALTRKWHHLILGSAESRGWTVDNVSDLERVMRVPGTFNNKEPNNPRPVSVSEQSGWRYSPEDFDMFLREIKPAVSVPAFHPVEVETKPSPRKDSDDALLLSLEAQPPIEKFQALIGNSRKANDTWEHKRKDLTDQSGSSYDMAMSNFCVAAGFSMQETVNTLIAMRRKHEDPNLVNKMREGYFKGTYEKAYATFSEEAELNRKREQAHKKYLSSDEETKRQGAIEMFNEMVGTNIIEVVCFKTDQAEYHIKTPKGLVVMTTDDVWSHASFSKKYFGAFQGKALPPMKLKEWRYKALDMLVEQATREGVIEEIKDEGSDRAAMRGWVEDYLIATKVHDELTLDTYNEGNPVRDSKGNIYIKNESVRRFIGRRRDNKIPVSKMPSLLKSAGLEPDAFRKIIGTGKVGRFWKLAPEKVIPFPKAKGDD